MSWQKGLILCGLNDLANEAVIAASKVSDFVLLRKVECQGGVRKMPSFHTKWPKVPFTWPNAMRGEGKIFGESLSSFGYGFPSPNRHFLCRPCVRPQKRFWCEASTQLRLWPNLQLPSFCCAVYVHAATIFE